MADQDKGPSKKISREFAARLAGSDPKHRFRAIILTGGGGEEKRRSVTRQTPRQRKKAIEEMQRAAEQALADIDDILSRFEGRRLAASPSVLGSIPVETTSAGIRALAESRWVKSIIEDQEAFPLK
jgi:hypothetical protein